jgi:hypothetical protein
MSGTTLNNYGGDSSSGTQATYDPVSDAVWVTKISNGIFWKWDVQTNTGTGIGQLSPTDTFFDTQVVDPLHHKLWQIGNQLNSTSTTGAGYTTLDGTNNYTDATSSMVGCTGWADSVNHTWPGAVWDSITSTIKVIQPAISTTTVWDFDPVSFTCKKILLNGASLPTGDYASIFENGVYGKFRMLPDEPGKAIYLTPSANEDAFIVTLDPPGLGSSTLACLDKDGDGYGVGPISVSPLTDLVVQPATPSVPSAPSVSVVGTPGTTTYYYSVSTCDQNYHDCTTPSTSTVVTTSPNTLSVSNYNHISWTDTSNTYIVMRSTTSSALSGTGHYQVLGVPSCSSGTCTLNDQDNTTNNGGTVLGGLFTTTVALSFNVSSAGHGFTSADLHRVITVTGGTGFIPGTGYFITAVNSGVATVTGSPGVQGLTGGHWQIDGCLGPDADDNDSSVHTGPDVITKYSTLSGFWAHKNYTPGSTWYLAPASPTAACIANAGGSGPCTGSDSNPGTSVTAPAHTWAHIQSAVVSAAGSGGGVMVVLRDGYSDNIYNTPSGAAGSPTIFVSYPGETADLDQGSVASSQIAILDKSWLIIDGIRCYDAACWQGGSTASGGSSDFTDNIFRNLDGYGQGGGSANGQFQAFRGLINMTIEDSVFRQSCITFLCTSGQHNIYIGDRGSGSFSKNVRIQRVILHDSAGYPAFQFNGTVTDLHLEQSMIYNSPSSTCVTLAEGVSHSYVREVSCFNSGAGLTFLGYDGDCYNGSGSSGICPHDQTYNTIENNIFAVGALDNAGNAIVQPAIQAENASTGCPPGYNGSAGYSIGDKVLFPFAVTGGTTYTNLTGVNTTPPSSDWTTGTACNMTKQGDMGTGNVVKNNILINSNGGSNNYASSFFANCNIGYYIFGGTCTLDTGDHIITNFTFTNNIFWSTGGGSSGVMGQAPPAGGGGWTTYNCTGAAAITNMSGCINSDPQLTTYSPTAYYNSPSSFNLKPTSSSPAIAAGTVSGGTIMTADLIGNPNHPTTPDLGPLAATCTISLSPTAPGPYTVGTPISTITATANGCGVTGSLVWTSSGAPTGLTNGCSGASATATCTITGTPSTAGVYSTMISVTDGGSNSASNNPTITVNAAPVSLPPAAITGSGVVGSGVGHHNQD